MAQAVPVRVDSKGRLSIPKAVRDALDVRPGDTYFFERDGDILRFVKAKNPFDALAEEAIREYRAGRTRTIEEIAREYGVDLNDGSE